MRDTGKNDAGATMIWECKREFGKKSNLKKIFSLS